MTEKHGGSRPWLSGLLPKADDLLPKTASPGSNGHKTGTDSEPSLVTYRRWRRQEWAWRVAALATILAAFALTAHYLGGKLDALARICAVMNNVAIPEGK